MWSLPIGENSGTIEDQVVQGSHNQKPSWTSLRSWTSGMGCRLKSPRLPSFPLQSRCGSGFGHGVKYLRWKHVCCGLPQASTLILYFSSYPHQLPEDLIWRHCIKKKNKKKSKGGSLLYIKCMSYFLSLNILLLLVFKNTIMITGEGYTASICHNAFNFSFPAVCICICWMCVLVCYM